MGQNKKAEFENPIQELARLHKSLSHPARIAILETLAERQSCICGEIVEVLPLAQATVSQHLKELKEAGLIRGEIEGNKSCYCINWETWEIYQVLVMASFSKINKFKKNEQGSCC